VSTTTRPAAPPLDLLPPAVRRRLLLPTTAAFAGLAVLVAGLSSTGTTVPLGVQAIPFAVSVLVFGLPHGALDHLVPARDDPTVDPRRSIRAVVALYAVLGGATALLWLLAPALGFGLFIAITWYHWGQGDLWIERARTASAIGRADAVLTLLLRGALPMLMPLVARPADYALVLSLTTRAAGGAVSGDGLLAPPWRIAAGAIVAALLVAHVAVRAARRTPLAEDLVETAVLLGFFAAVPPVLAVGLYFTFWHSVRHIVRLELLDPVARRELADGRLLGPFARFLRDAWPVTLCAVALLVALALLVHDAGLGTYLLLIAALTTPHAVVVTWMDRRTARRLQAEHAA
jgi:beta-carotene 15,15'-dioxygenase